MSQSASRRTRLWAPAVGWAAVVLVVSLVDPPGAATPTTGPFGVFPADKWQHGVGYAVLGALVSRALDRSTARAALWALALAVGFGCGVELCQSFLPWRTAGLADAAANTVGASVGVAAWRLRQRSLPSR